MWVTARHVAALVSQFAPSALSLWSPSFDFMETSDASFLSLVSAEMSVKSSFPLLYWIIMLLFGWQQKSFSQISHYWFSSQTLKSLMYFALWATRLCAHDGCLMYPAFLQGAGCLRLQKLKLPCGVFLKSNKSCILCSLKPIGGIHDLQQTCWIHFSSSLAK